MLGNEGLELLPLFLTAQLPLTKKRKQISEIQIPKIPPKHFKLKSDPLLIVSLRRHQLDTWAHE